MQIRTSIWRFGGFRVRLRLFQNRCARKGPGHFCRHGRCLRRVEQETLKKHKILSRSIVAGLLSYLTCKTALVSGGFRSRFWAQIWLLMAPGTRARSHPRTTEPQQTSKRPRESPK